MAGTSRFAIFLGGVCLASTLGGALGQGDDEVCQADGTGCASMGTPTDFAEDGISQDIHNMCPVSRSSVRNYIQSLLKFFGRRLGLHRFIGLWPQDVSADGWADDYTVMNYLLVSRISLGLYKTRGPEYIRIPTGMASTDLDSLIRVENIHAPRLDVDGSPNFFWFEKWIPGIFMKTLYVPAVTCFYSTLRRMSTDNNELNGNFTDDLDSLDFNTWEAAMKDTSFKSKLEWAAAFYDIAKAWDGHSIWPKQMTNFQTYFKNDEWDDGLEHAFAFHLIASHRVEHGAWTFADLPGLESLTLPFRVPLNMFSKFAVREHFGKYGADLYFNQDGMPALIETPAGDKILRGDKQWQYWKFVWRSTLVTAITLVDHLHITHFRTANILARVTREALEPDFPLRRISTIFSFGSIFVNLQAMHTLVGPNHLLHRATPFKDFEALSNLIPSSDSQIVADLTDIPGIKALINQTVYNGLHPMIRQTPFFADGLVLMKAIQKMVKGVLDASYEKAICPGGKVNANMQRWRALTLVETRAAHYTLNQDGMEYVLDEHPCDHPHYRVVFEQRLSAYFFMVTGWHRHVGFVGDYYLDPMLATMSWKDGESFGRPRQHMLMTVINVFTSTHQPLLKEDYSYLFDGMKPDLGTEFSAVWKEFLKDLDALEKVVDERNAKRKVVNYNMHPSVLECSVAK